MLSIHYRWQLSKPYMFHRTITQLLISNFFQVSPFPKTTDNLFHNSYLSWNHQHTGILWSEFIYCWCSYSSSKPNSTFWWTFCHIKYIVLLEFCNCIFPYVNIKLIFKLWPLIWLQSVVTMCLIFIFIFWPTDLLTFLFRPSNQLRYVRVL